MELEGRWVKCGEGQQKTMEGWALVGDTSSLGLGDFTTST